MKFSILKNVTLALCLSVALVYIPMGCSKKADLIEDTVVDGVEEGSVIDDPGAGVAGNFDWSTSRTITVQVPVGDEFSAAYYYKLELFDREPHLAGAKLLGAGLAKRGQDLVTKITVPNNLNGVFVQKTSPIGEKSYSILDITPSASFASAKLASANLSRGINKLASTTPVSKEPPAVPMVPANAKEISGAANVTATANAKTFVIKKGELFAGDITGLNSSDVSGIVVYVYGKWHHANDVNLAGNSRVVIMPGGLLDVNNLKLNGGTASVEAHGDMLLNGMVINDNASFKNVGTLVVKGLVSLSGSAQFVNYQSDVKVKVGAATLIGSQSVLTNNGELEILNGSFTDGTLNANCYTTVGKMKTSNATVNIWGESMLDVTNLDAQGGEYNLYAKGVLDVTNLAIFKANAKNEAVRINNIGNAWDKKSYVRIKYVRVGEGQKSHVAYNGFMSIITDEHPNYADNTFTVSGTGVEVYWDLYNHPPYIAATSCNNGGQGIFPTTPPVDQILTKVNLGAHTYLFEDNWPNIGDYDLNDLVMSVNITKYQNKLNQVEKVELTCKITASGARRAIAAAIQLDNISSGLVRSATYSASTKKGSRIPLGPNGVEADQSKAVVTVADFVHEAFGLTGANFIFTEAGDAYKPLETTITVEFNAPIANFSFEDINPFIVNPYGVQPFGVAASGKRYEIHMIGRPGTDKFDTDLALRAQGKKPLPSDDATYIVLDDKDPFKVGDVKTNAGNSLKGWPFAISIPTGDFVYQRTEGAHLTVKYPKFSEWIISGGTQASDWYTQPK